MGKELSNQCSDKIVALEIPECRNPSKKTLDDYIKSKTFVFIYSYGGKIKALNEETAKKQNYELLKRGWTHTHTLDACLWIEYLHNKCNNIELLEEINSLSI